MSDARAPNDRCVLIDIRHQRLQLLHSIEDSSDACLLDCAISTAINGPGERFGSECTPRGRHRIRLKIGADCPPGAVFCGRRWTGEIYSPALQAAEPGRDWILTRILWLTGTEPGRNRGGAVDSLRRFIYIHGCPPSEPMGVPGSHGCVRLRDKDLLRLFDLVAVGTRVEIH